MNLRAELLRGAVERALLVHAISHSVGHRDEVVEEF